MRRSRSRSSPDADAVAERGAEIVAEQAAAADRRSRSTSRSRSRADERRGRCSPRLSGRRCRGRRSRSSRSTSASRLTAIRTATSRQLQRSLPPGGAADVRADAGRADDLDGPRPRTTRRRCPDALDLVHLGLGPDGHTASLVPGDPVLDVADRDVAVTGVLPGPAADDADVPDARTAPGRSSGSSPARTRSTPCVGLQAGDRSIPGGAGHPRRTRSSSPTPLRQDLRHERAGRSVSTRSSRRRPAVLSVDVGGSNVKAVLNGHRRAAPLPSPARKLTAQQMVDGVLEMTQDWDYVAVSVGIPAPVDGRDGGARPGQPRRRLGGASISRRRSAKPTKVINDADHAGPRELPRAAGCSSWGSARASARR